ncbi:HpcH/HpaI aldolase/citrate lyase family protein [Mesorhizobium sp. ANAO-SY3R2]|uniref:HpcH/HpaI aldolase/citrate lyase family protein n=1 Tax=Mesorhizobium sp. ANAO-SY3R2 TaxID=3166644 RepID=UPI0036719331
MNDSLSAARSWLFVPGDSERKIAKSWDSGADVLIFDIEDSVPPENKAAARAQVASALKEARASHVATPCVVRINCLATGLAVDDIPDTIEGRPAAYVAPKVGSAADVLRIAEMLDEQEARFGIEAGTTGIIPIATETPDAIFRMHEIAHAHRRVRALFWGMEDLATELGAHATRDRNGMMLDVFRTVRSLALLAGASAGIGIVDTPFTALADAEGLVEEAADASVMGFTGKLAIHPSQVAAINRAFTPSAHQIAEAEAILALSRDGGGAAFRYQGRMIDTPHLVAARKLLAKINPTR